MTRTRAALTVALSSSIAALAMLVVAGPIEPPLGSVAPSYKTLQSVEPRTEISSVPIVINSPGSFYLGNALSHSGPLPAITITASGVSIDLNGFPLNGTSGTGPGVLVQADGIEIKNGLISGFDGAAISGSGYSSLRAHHLTLEFNGGPGIITWDGAVISDIISRYNGTAGTGSPGIQLRDDFAMRDCVTSQCGGRGIEAGRDGTITNCTASWNNGEGIWATLSVRLNGCSVVRNTSHGISVEGSCTVTECNAHENGWFPIVPGVAGIHVRDQATRVENNHIVACPIGIKVTFERSIVVRNTLTYCPIPIDAVSPNTIGELIRNPSTGTHTLNAANSSPWANIASD